jgi:HD-GYP domain-containing protein (c-di-GMP phosphodiesterase class II)
MSLPQIVLSLRGSGPVPRTWSSNCHLRIGRLSELEIALDDLSISRLHAEVYLTDEGWAVRDRGSSNGTALNGTRIGRTPQPVREGDVIQVGALAFVVDRLRGRPVTVRIGLQTVEEAPDEPRAENGLLQLIRAAHRLAQPTADGDPLQELLDNARRFFRARRAAVFVIDDATEQPAVRAFSAAGAALRPPGKTLAAVALRGRRSMLFRDRSEAAEHLAESAVRGDMNSIVCAVLRAADRDVGVLHLDRGPEGDPFTPADMDAADALGGALALGLDRRGLVERHETLFVQTVTALAQAVEMRDTYTGNHTQRVTAYSLLLAEELGLPDDQRRRLRVATLLHDIGKIAIDDQILRKPGRLSDAEFAAMRTHVLRGSEIIQMIPGLSWALPVVRGHHERYDGKGYPDGLAGEAIPLIARVVAVADAFDAMTSDRPYRAGMPVARAYEELLAGAGTHFDPDCVDAFLRARPKVEALLEKEAAERRSAETGSNTISRAELERERQAVMEELKAAATAGLPPTKSHAALPVPR